MSSSGRTDKARKTKRVYGSKSKHACVCCRHRQKKVSGAFDAKKLCVVTDRESSAATKAMGDLANIARWRDLCVCIAQWRVVPVSGVLCHVRLASWLPQFRYENTVVRHKISFHIMCSPRIRSTHPCPTIPKASIPWESVIVMSTHSNFMVPEARQATYPGN